MINNDKVNRCSKCNLPETYETIEFDQKNVCNLCKGAEYKQTKIDWNERKKLLDQLIEKHKGKYSYDCIVPFSGGKDSTFQLYYLMKNYNIKPLVVRFNHGFFRETVLKNGIRTLKKLGADFIEFTPNWKIVKRLMLETFKRKTDFCWHCHTGIFSYPLRLALMYKVPLIFYGEPQAEFHNYYDYMNDEIDYSDSKKFNLFHTLGITAEDMHGMINTKENPIDKRDLIPYTFPNLKELAELNYQPVALGSFIPWDYVKQTEIIKKELGWEVDELEHVPKELNKHGEKTECFAQATRDYIKWLKRGYGRVSQINGFLVRNGKMKPEIAKDLDEKYDGIKPQSLEIFLEYMGLTEKEFNEIIDTMVIPPHEANFKNNKFSKKLWDYDQWYREDNRKKK